WNGSKAWAGNPGIPDRTANFTRPIIPFCLDCHSTFFEPIKSTENGYKTDSALLGVSCEKCHGPAAGHVAARRANRRATAPARRPGAGRSGRGEPRAAHTRSEGRSLRVGPWRTATRSAVLVPAGRPGQASTTRRQPRHIGAARDGVAGGEPGRRQPRPAGDGAD